MLEGIESKGLKPVKYILDLNRGGNYYYSTKGFGSTKIVKHFESNIQDRSFTDPDPFLAKWPEFPNINYIKMALPKTSTKNPGSLEDA